MSKTGNVGSKVKTQTLFKRPKGAKPELAINTTESNPAGDLQVRVLSAGLVSGSILLFGAGAFWAGQRLSTALTHSPVDWLSAILMIATVAIMLFVLRSLVWMSFFGAIMLAARLKAWKSQESLCRLALRMWRIIPAAASTASLVLAQNLLGQDKSEEAIKIAEEHWQRSGSAGKPDQNLALLCSTVGLAYQMRGEARESIAWNERAIGSFKGVMEQVSNPKGLMAKFAASQSSQWIGPLRMHQAVAHLHNANAYFSTMNYRQAKENYKRAVDCANQAPDSAEKKEVLHVAREQMARLKHA